LESVPVPLPANYLCGIDMQKKELEEQKQQGLSEARIFLISRAPAIRT
jgi:hypothetical protein